MRAWLAITVVAALGVGCVSLKPQEVPTRYYLLDTPSAGPDAAPASAWEVGSVSVPDYLDTPRIAIRTGPHEVRYLEWERWASPLADQVRRSVVHLASNQTPPGSPGSRVSFEFLRLDAWDDGRTAVEVLVTFAGDADHPRRLAATGSWTPGDYASLAASLSSLLRDIVSQAGQEAP